jgi:6-phosphogluconolactonase
MKNTMSKVFIPAILLISFALLATSCKNQRVKEQPRSDSSDSSSQILYIGTYTENEADAGGKATGIYVYKMDMTTGRLSYLGSSSQTTNPSYIAVNPESEFLYAVNETGSDRGEPSGSVSAFRLTNGGKGMEFINTVASAGNFPCFIQLDKTGKYAMTANYGSGTVALLPINADGSLGKAVSVDHHAGKGRTSRQEAAHAHMIVPSRDNRYVYSCDLGTDHIYIYRLDLENGKLIPADNSYSTQPGSGPRHLIFHPLRNFAYVVNELNGTIECMKVDTITGALTRFQTISTIADGNGQEASSADIHMASSGKYLYASNRGIFNNIAMYSVHSQTGELTLIGHQDVKGKTPRNFVIDPTGTYLLVANQDTDNVVTFRIDADTGKLIDIGVETNIPTPVCLKFLQ